MRACSWALALLFAASACSDVWEPAKPANTAASGSPTNTPVPVLPPEGAGQPLPPDHPTADDIARASATDLAREPNTVDWTGGNSAHGQTLFANQCATCHGGSGNGEGLATPALNPKPRDFTQGRFYIDASANNKTGEDVDIARVILHGPRAFGGSQAMPAFEGTLSESDVRDLIAYVRTFAHS